MAFEEAKAIYGLTQMNKSKKALNRLANWKPEFRSGESILQEATAKTPYGYSAQETAAFNNSLARTNNMRYRLASQSNPNMASNINAGIQYSSLGALNEFARNDASLKQQKIGQLTNMIRSQDNMNVSNQINQKSQMEQAYGEAYKAGLSNVVGAFDSKMNDLKTVASFVIPFAGAGGGAQGKGTTTQMATSLLPNSVTNPNGAQVPNQLSFGRYGNAMQAPTIPMNGSNQAQTPSTLSIYPDSMWGKNNYGAYGNGYAAPINKAWRSPTSNAPLPPPPTNPYPMQGWITNPNQYNPY